MRYLVLLLVLCHTGFPAQPLPVEQAFKPIVSVRDPNTVNIHWKIAPGYNLYKSRLHFNSDSSTLTLGKLHLPHGKPRQDPLTHENYQIYDHDQLIQLPILGLKAGRGIIHMIYQGCAQSGFCYPPVYKDLAITIDPQLSVSQASLFKETNTAERVLTQQSTLWIVLSFLGFGVLLAFTPCVLPMVPVLSSLIIGQHISNNKRAFSLALSYVISMSFTYALIGMGIAELGANIQTALQTPWALVLSSALFFILAATMFDLFEIKLPASIHDKIHQRAAQQQGGSYLSCIFMGALSTLILTPCVTAPLVGALSFIAQSGNLTLGGIALFLLGLGMGIPLLIFVTLGQRFLPKSGPWMHRVKHFFGILLCVVAILLLSRLPMFTASSTEGLTRLAEVKEKLRQYEGSPTIIEFYANWCLSCKVMDKRMQKPEVQHALKNWHIIKVDLSKRDAYSHELEQHFHVIAPPTFLFIQADGTEKRDLRIIGETSTTRLLQQIKRDKA